MSSQSTKYLRLKAHTIRGYNPQLRMCNLGGIINCVLSDFVGFDNAPSHLNSPQAELMRT
jgi:hypothetical protein